VIHGASIRWPCVGAVGLCAGRASGRLVAAPKVSFLDEPSSGMDVATRRNLWAVVSQSLGAAAVVLTTHSMEEADALSSRIGSALFLSRTAI
jgi:ABC-type nitrate/sulfonate/bicarbonate transport system ATPase subunit